MIERYGVGEPGSYQNWKPPRSSAIHDGKKWTVLGATARSTTVFIDGTSQDDEHEDFTFKLPF